MARAGGELRTSEVLRRLLRASPVAFVLAGLCGLLAIVPALAVPLLIRAFLDQYLVADSPEWLAPVLIGLAAATVTAGLLTWLQYRVLARFATRLSASTSTRFAWHALRLPVPVLDEQGIAAVTARGSALQRLSFQTGLIVPLAMVNVVSLLVFAAALLAMDLRLGLAAIVVVAVSVVAATLILRRREARQTAASRLRVAQAALSSELVAGIETIKASASEQWVFDRWAQARAEMGRAVSPLGVASQRLGTVAPLTQTVGFGIVLALGSWLVVGGQLSLGTLVASQGFLVQALVAAGKLAWLGVLLQVVTSGARQADLIERQPLDVEVTSSGPRRASDGAEAVRLRLERVTFGYDRGLPALLRDIDLDVPAGTRVAIVGGSGSGKSTLARLIIGELQPWSGRVLLDEVPRLEHDRAWRGSAVGYVPQAQALVPGTIRDNITLFDDTVAPAAVATAVDDARIGEAIGARPLGLETPVLGGAHGFSGGEMQRLSLARALVGRPRLLVLDEATSALDPVVEAEVEDRLRQRRCTQVVIAHRLSTVRDADWIVVLDAGRIVQQGPFDQVRRAGAFAELILHG